MAAKDFPLAYPGVLPEWMRGIARENARRVDVIPCTKFASRELPRVRERQRLAAPVCGQVRHAGLRQTFVRTRAGEPVPKLLERAGVVVVPLRFAEEWIQIRIGIERHADDEIRMLAHQCHDCLCRLLEIALFVAAHILRVHVERQ